jgi:hypothetical protein
MTDAKNFQDDDALRAAFVDTYLRNIVHKHLVQEAVRTLSERAASNISPHDFAIELLAWGQTMYNATRPGVSLDAIVKTKIVAASNPPTKGRKKAIAPGRAS